MKKQEKEVPEGTHRVSQKNYGAFWAIVAILSKVNPKLLFDNRKEAKNVIFGYLYMEAGIRGMK